MHLYRSVSISTTISNSTITSMCFHGTTVPGIKTRYVSGMTAVVGLLGTLRAGTSGDEYPPFGKRAEARAQIASQPCDKTRYPQRPMSLVRTIDVYTYLKSLAKTESELEIWSFGPSSRLSASHRDLLNPDLGAEEFSSPA